MHQSTKIPTNPAAANALPPDGLVASATRNPANKSNSKNLQYNRSESPHAKTRRTERPGNLSPIRCPKP
jgi:hypothetical protein